jgi:hypothetical protein
MKDNNLIASVALFSELYNSDTYKNIPEIIAEFIRGAVIFENKFSFNSTELKDLLNRIYGFDIPESVIRTTLQNKFKDEIKRENNYFHFDQSIKNRQSNINSDFNEISKSQNLVIEEIYSYIGTKKRINLESKDKREILENVFHFLMDNGYSEKYSDLISAFILTKEKDTNFRELINSIKEGLILYQGINYTADINQLGSWNNDLTIYLATEHLFNALGYNGILYKEIFDDFNKLVFEINSSHKNNKRKKIELKYLEETKIEIDNFFQTAESIKKGNKSLDPSKLAMETILKKSNSLSDIRTLRVQFDIELKKLGIQFQDFNYSIDRTAQYNVVDQNTMDELKKISEEKGRYFDEDNCQYYFNLFTKINTFRKGINNNRFEKCGHLYLTETAFAKYLAHNNLVKFEDYDTPFAKDIDFVTTRFWFTLKKGFSNKQSLPKSFDVITKAKIILASHLTNSISSNYQDLLADKRSGKLTEDEAIARSYSLREKPNTPEEINLSNIDEALDFIINENHLEDFYREKVRKEQLLETTQKEKEELELALQSYKDKEIEDTEKTKKIEFGIRKSDYVNKAWNEHKKSNNKDLILLVSITILTFVLIAVPFFIGLSKDIKVWFLQFQKWQIFLIIIYLIIATTDILGSRYLYKKDNISNGWNWLKNLSNYTKYKEFKKHEFEKDYNE